MKYFFLLIWMLFFYSSLISQEIDFKYCEKSLLLLRILDDPNNVQNIIQNSIFFDKATPYDDKQFRLGIISLNEYINLIRDNIVIIYSSGFFRQIEKYNDTSKYDEYKNLKIDSKFVSYDTYVDSFILKYVGQKNERIFNPSITISFSLIKNKWIINRISFGKEIFVCSTKETLINVAKRFHNNSIIDTGTVCKPKNYSFCEKITEIKSILENPQSISKKINPSIYNKNLDSCKFNDFRNCELSLQDYLSFFTNNFNIFLNYPFPVDDYEVDKYLCNSLQKDYFIIKYKGDNRFLKSPFLTFEFTLTDSLWYLTDITIGVPNFIAYPPIDANDELTIIEAKLK